MKKSGGIVLMTKVLNSLFQKCFLRVGCMLKRSSFEILWWSWLEEIFKFLKGRRAPCSTPYLFCQLPILLFLGQWYVCTIFSSLPGETLGTLAPPLCNCISLYPPSHLSFPGHGVPQNFDSFSSDPLCAFILKFNLRWHHFLQCSSCWDRGQVPPCVPAHPGSSSGSCTAYIMAACFYLLWGTLQQIFKH